MLVLNKSDISIDIFQYQDCRDQCLYWYSVVFILT